MFQIFFSFRFQSQLRRTRAKLLLNLEKSIVGTIENFGGTVRIEHKLINASFDGTSVCFWLDMLCVLENIKAILEKASSELYGHICVLGEDIHEDDIQLLARGLPSDLWGTGIWCSPPIRSILEPYMVFDPPLGGADYNEPIKGYSQLKEIRNDPAHEVPADNSEKICQYLGKGKPRNTVVVGSEFIGKREGLYRFCGALMEGFPPLVIRFTNGGNTVTCIADALSPRIRSVLGLEEKKRDSALVELENLGNLIFKERLREQVSDFLIKQGQRFFTLILELYRGAADKAGVKPVLILEDMQKADPLGRFIITGIYASLPQRERILVYGTCTGMETLEPWEEIFPRIVKFSPGGDLPVSDTPKDMPELPRDLWELAYVCALFGTYFPAYLIPRLLVEEGKNPAMINRGLSLLSLHAVINSPEDTLIKLPRFIFAAEAFLGKRGETIRELVRKRLLVWVETSRIKPCFKLLETLKALGGEGDEQLMLEAVCGDVINGTYSGIEQSMSNKSFENIVGKDRAASLLSIFRTQKALNHGNPEEISGAFVEPFPSETAPGFKARMYADYACYCLGICDADSAETAIKEAMLISQRENAGRGLDHLYRLFSLVEFSNRQLSDAIDYFAFAVENAEKSENYAELAVIAYYAAGVHFLFGNISNAERLALRSEEAALTAGRPGWADRSCFLRGRIRFDLGRCQDALDIFKSLEKDFTGPESEEMRQTLGAWIYRANVYLHNRVEHQGGLDAELFEVEAAFLSGEYRKTLELANKLENNFTLGDTTSRGSRFLFIEQPDWRSGFAQCELFLFPLRDLWDRMILTYRALALCHLSGAEPQDKEEAARDMQRVMRDELPEMDPNVPFYLYSYYQILKRSGAPEVDMNTAISLAFKRLQRRASRIDDNEVKRAFLSLPYWNGALMVAAKEHKLI